MKKAIVLLWVVLLLPITSLLAQTEGENKEVYIQLKKWAVVKLTIAYMEDLYSYNPNEISKKGSKEEYQTYKTLYAKTSSLNDIIDLEEVAEILINGNWKKTKSKVFEKYKIELIDNKERFNFDNIEPFGYDDKMVKIKYNEALKEISKEFDNKVSNKADARKKEEDKERLIEVKESNKQKEKPLKGNQYRSIDSDLNNSSIFIFYGIIGLLILIIIILIIKTKNLKENKKRLKNNISPAENKNSNLTILPQENNSLDNEVKDLKKIIIDLNKKIQDQNSDATSIKPSEKIEISDDQLSEEIVLEVPKKFTESNIIYLSSPFQNLTFANEDASKDKTINSLYQVDFNKQIQTGYLTILVDADLSKALNSPDTYLETACVYDNEYSNNARAIKIIEKGEIKLDGEDWIVTKKMRIKFI